MGGLTFVSEEGTELAELDDIFDALDGSRALRVRYVSPEFAGFELAASLRNNRESLNADDDPEGDGVSPAIALLFGNEFGGYELEGVVEWGETRFSINTFYGENAPDETPPDRRLRPAQPRSATSSPNGRPAAIRTPFTLG